MIEKRDLIDWYSFTVPITHNKKRRGYNVLDQANKALISFLGNVWERLVADDPEWLGHPSRPPYQSAFTNGHGIVVYISHSVDNVLVEITGQGCDYLRGIDLLSPLIATTHERATRIDIATDIKTSVRPSRFVSAGYNKAFKSRSDVVSPTGETVYLGSRKSYRYCRVYRYNEPHPRHSWLRIEYVYRKAQAKSIARALSAYKVREIAGTSASVYKWGSSLMKNVFTEVDMSAYEPERRNSNTVVWLISQAAPAFRKLVKSGAIEHPAIFLNTHFLEDSQDEDDSND